MIAALFRKWLSRYRRLHIPIYLVLLFINACINYGRHPSSGIKDASGIFFTINLLRMVFQAHWAHTLLGIYLLAASVYNIFARGIPQGFKVLGIVIVIINILHGLLGIVFSGPIKMLN